MVSVDPSRLPLARDDIARFSSSPLLPMLLTEQRDQGGRYELPLPEAAMAWHDALDAYQRRLVDLTETATLYHVPAATTAAITTARDRTLEHRLLAEDLPAEQGLVLFDTPISRTPPERDPNIASRLPPASVIGVLWGPARRADGRPGVLAVLWTDTSELVEHDERSGHRHQAAKRREVAGLVTYHDEAVLAHGETYPSQCPPNEDPVRHDALTALLRTWSLMRRPCASIDVAPMPRQTRRKFERRGQPPPNVHVLTLHEPAASRTDRR